MRTTISLPNDLFTAAAALADRLGVSRSELFATALAEFVAKHDESVAARLDRVHAEASVELDPAFRRLQRQAVGPEVW